MQIVDYIIGSDSMEKDRCNIFKILFICSLFIIGVLSLILVTLNHEKCNCIKGKASKIFDDMGNLIGEFSFRKR